MLNEWRCERLYTLETQLVNTAVVTGDASLSLLPSKAEWEDHSKCQGFVPVLTVDKKNCWTSLSTANCLSVFRNVL